MISARVLRALALTTWLETVRYEDEHNGADEANGDGRLALILAADQRLPVRRLSCNELVVNATLP
jgi:hypothetical protein